MSLAKRIRHFLQDSRATLSVEAVLIFPLLLWAYFGMFVLFEGYRTLGANTRASYTIADLLSREPDWVTPSYVEGLNDVLDILTQSPHRTVLRITVIKYNNDTDEYELQWSHATDGMDKIVTGTLTEIMPFVPIMASPGVAIVVETWMAFEPFMNITLDSFYFESIVVTRPRFGPQLCFTALTPPAPECVPSS